MKTLTPVIALAILLFTSCHNAPDKRPNKSVIVPQSISTKVLVKESVKDSSVILSHVITHRFSNTSHRDTFKLLVKGTELVNAKVNFNIVDYKGRKIYEEVFDAVDLIGLSLAPDSITGAEPGKKRKEDFIRKRIKDFFAEGNFSMPAIERNSTFDDDDLDKSIWRDIKSDNTAIGFIYTLDAEDTKSIAYSKKRHKVVVYFGCC